MDDNALFWATGIDNSGLETDKAKAVQIFKDLSTDVNNELGKIDKEIANLKEAGNFKFKNPVDPSMITSIKGQIEELGKVIDAEIQKLGDFSYHYDTAMKHIRDTTSKIPDVPAQDPLGPTVNNIKKRVHETDTQMSFLQRIFRRAVSYMAIYGGIDWAKNFAKQIIVTKGQFDQLEVAINAFIGNTSRSKALLNDVTNFAIKSPFQLLDITQSTRQLLAYGVQAKDVMRTLKLLSDLAAGSGQKIEDITYLYGSSMTRGRVYAREMYQFASRGIPIWQALSKEMGVNSEQLTKMVRNGQVGFSDLQKALENLAGPGGRYFNISDKIASTTYGRLSNLEDAWKKALDEIGNDNEGIINSGIDLTSKLIQHWEAVANAIKAVVVAVGTYKAAQIAVGVKNNAVTASFSQGYVNSVSRQGGITSDFAARASQAGLVKGSEEYQRALAKELALQVEKANITIANANKEIASNEELINIKNQEIAEINAAIAAKKQEAAASLANGDSQGAETASTEANSLQEQLNTAERDKNTASAKIETASKELSTAETTKNTTQTVINTAEKEANTVSTGAMTVATTMLGRAWASLTAFMEANEFALIAAGISLVVYALYKMYQQVSKNTSGWQEWDKIQKKIDDDEQKMLDNGNKLIDKMTSTNSTLYERIRAYQQLKSQYPQLFKDMKEENALAKSGAYWYEKLADAIDRKTQKKSAAAVTEANQNVVSARQEYKGAVETYNMSSGLVKIAAKVALDRVAARLKLAKETAMAANKAAADAKRAQNAANTIAKKPTKNYAYWQDVDQTQTNIMRAIPDVGRTKAQQKEWDKAENLQRIAEQHLKNWDKASKKDKDAETAKRRRETAAERAERLREQRAQFASEVKMREQQINSNNEEIKSYEDKAEDLRRQAYTDRMEKGYFYDKQVIEDDYNKRVADIEAQQDKIVKLMQQNEKMRWQNIPKKNRGVFHYTVKSWSDVPTVDRKGIDDELTAANEIRKSKEAALQRDLLKQYDDYVLQREEIDRKYESDRNALLDIRGQYKEGTSEYDEINLRLAQNQKERVVKQNELSFKQQKESPLYQLAYSDLSKVSSDALQKLVDMLKKYRTAAEDAYDPENISTYTEEIDKAVNQIIKQDPIGYLKRSREEIKKAKEDYISALKEEKAAQDELRMAQNSVSSLSSQKSSLKDEATDIEEKQISGTAPTGSEQNLANIRKQIVSITDKETTANMKLAASQDKVTMAQERVTTTGAHVTETERNQIEAANTVNDEIGKLYESLDKVGSAIGGTVGQVISLIGSIGSTVTSSIKAFQDVSQMEPGAMKTIAAVSTTLSVISAGVQVAQKVVSLFKHESWAEKEYKALVKLNTVLEKNIDLYKQLLATEAGAEAKNTGEQYLNTLKRTISDDYQEAYDKMKKHSEVSKAFLSESDMQQIQQIDPYFSYTSHGGKWHYVLGDIHNLTEEQLKELQERFPEVIANLSDDAQTAINDIITKTEELRDAENEVDKAITGIDFDSLKDGMDDLLLSTDATMSQVSDNFEDYMRKAILNLVKQDYLSKALEDWYDSFAQDLSNDNQLSETEIGDLKQKYEDIYTEAQKEVDQLLGIADITKSDTSANTIKSSFESMSEDQADVLTAQFSAIRINVADIDVYLKEEQIVVETIRDDVAQIRINTSFIADIKSQISDIQTNGLKMK